MSCNSFGFRNEVVHLDKEEEDDQRGDGQESDGTKEGEGRTGSIPVRRDHRLDLVDAFRCIVSSSVLLLSF